MNLPAIFSDSFFLIIAIPLLFTYLWRLLFSRSWLCYASTKVNNAILERCPSILKNSFNPTLYLQSHLLQTLFASLVPARVNKISYTVEEFNTQGGGHTSLAWVTHSGDYASPKHSRILIVIIPGLTGSAEDNYVKDLVHSLSKEKYRCVVYQPRFNGGRLILPQEGFVDILKDFKATVEHIKQQEPGVKLLAIGHSYGANLLVNYLGTYNADNAFLAGVSIANPFNFMLGENKMRGSLVDRGITSFLHDMVTKSKSELAQTVRFNLNLDDLLALKNIRDFDRNFTIKVYGYDTVDDYYWGVSSCRRLKSVKVPLFMLQAEDDPVVEANSFRKDEIEKSNSNVLLKMTSGGGHQGWIEGFFVLRRWYLKPVVEYVNAVVDISDV